MRPTDDTLRQVRADLELLADAASIPADRHGLYSTDRRCFDCDYTTRSRALFWQHVECECPVTHGPLVDHRPEGSA